MQNRGMICAKAGGCVKLALCDNKSLNPARFVVQCVLAGPCALWNGESGQVGNEAATASLYKCRRSGSPFSLPLFEIRPFGWQR